MGSTRTSWASLACFASMGRPQRHRWPPIRVKVGPKNLGPPSQTGEVDWYKLCCLKGLESAARLYANQAEGIKL